MNITAEQLKNIIQEELESLLEEEEITEDKICPKGKAWAKRTFDTYPSAYANLAASKYCKDPNYAKGSKKKSKKSESIEEGDLQKWVDEDWVRVTSSGKIAGKCGTSKNKKNPDRCLPRSKAQGMSKGERAATGKKKKAAQKSGKDSGKSSYVSNTKKGKVTKSQRKSARKNESLAEAEISDNEREELEDVSKQLKGAVKAHGKQAKTIDKALKKEGVKNCGCGQDPCKTYGRVNEEVVNEEELEEGGKCTKVTKKASSTRDGKKWMKCVKSDSGGYKRIHWGQAGVRVTGKSGNTKRKKSFKKRHNCSKAKSNTPQGQACKDWAEE
jgi:hypothetical protein